jgi:hypothetical protein
MRCSYPVDGQRPEQMSAGILQRALDLQACPRSLRCHTDHYSNGAKVNQQVQCELPGHSSSAVIQQ